MSAGDDLTQEIDQLRIKHYGPCPFHKGHDGAVFVGGLAVGLFLGLFAALLAGVIVDSTWRDDAIRYGVGYELNGNWLWGHPQ